MNDSQSIIIKKSNSQIRNFNRPHKHISVNNSQIMVNKPSEQAIEKSRRSLHAIKQGSPGKLNRSAKFINLPQATEIGGVNSLKPYTNNVNNNVSNS